VIISPESRVKSGGMGWANDGGGWVGDRFMGSGSFLVGGLLCLVGCFASNYLFSVQAPRPSTANMGKRMKIKSIWFSPWLDFFKVFEEV
jgi:hypothetical protein